MRQRALFVRALYYNVVGCSETKVHAKLTLDYTQYMLRHRMMQQETSGSLRICQISKHLN